jgi:hypothetical protein
MLSQYALTGASPLIFSRFSPYRQARCEAILRSQPNARIAKELHLASIEAEEEHQREQIKQAAVGSVAVAAAIGVVAGIAMLMKKR